MDERFDLVIIGAGSAGEAAATLARGRGASVAVVERDLVGGDCPFWACMPSKSLLHAASIHAAGGRGDWAHAAARRDEVIERKGSPLPSDAGHVRDLEAVGAVLVRGVGRIAGPGRVIVSKVSRDGVDRTLMAGAILIAVGSVAQIPDIDGLDGIEAWTTREAATVTELPASLVILGAGPAGIELAQVFARFGVPTTLVASGERIYPKGHPRSAAALDATLRRDGVVIRTGVRATRVRPGAGADGAHALDLSDGSVAQGHALLLATGRKLPLADLGLETIGVDVTGGRLAVGPDLRIADGVFVAGDPATPEMFTHVAHYQGQLAVRIALGDRVRPDLRAIPRAVYTDPEVAGVGLQLEAAVAEGHDAFEETIDLAATAKGLAFEATGHATIVVDRSTRRLLGAFIAGPAAAEAIHEAVLAIRAGITLDVLSDTIHAFPTTARVMSELFQKAVNTLGDGA
jgi:dihydrolipoamide dehydrogenase